MRGFWAEVPDSWVPKSSFILGLAVLGIGGRDSWVPDVTVDGGRGRAAESKTPGSGAVGVGARPARFPMTPRRGAQILGAKSNGSSDSWVFICSDVVASRAS